MHVPTNVKLHHASQVLQSSLEALWQAVEQAKELAAKYAAQLTSGDLCI